MADGHGAAGWYDDPGGSGDQRWWDGTTWTQHRRARPKSVLELTPAERKAKNRRTWLALAVITASLVAIVAVVSVTHEPEPSSGRDSLATAACYDAYKLGRDADLLTDSEIRERVKDIHDNAQYSDTPGIAPAARRMLAAATAVDASALLSAVEDLAEACNPGG